VAHIQLNPGQTFDTALRIYRPSTITVTIADPPTSGTYNVGVSSDRTAQVFTLNGCSSCTGSLTITTLGSPCAEPIVPDTYRVSAWSTSGSNARFSALVIKPVPSAYPTVLTQTFALSLGSQLGPSSFKNLSIDVVVDAADDDDEIPYARVEVTGGPASNPPGPFRIAGTADDDGEITFKLPSGTSSNPYTYTIRAWRPADGTAGTATVSITNGNESREVRVP